MLVARSFLSSSPPREMLDSETPGKRTTRKNSSTPRVEKKHSTPVLARQMSAARPTVESTRTPTKPVDVPSPDIRGVRAQPVSRGISTGIINSGAPRPSTDGRRSESSNAVMCAPKSKAHCSTRRKQPLPEKHRPDALSPSVAALLAMTAIPPRRSSPFRRRSSNRSKISIDELVTSWKSDDSLPGSGSSPCLSVLLEDVDNAGFLHTRSRSSDSVPSLEADDRSVLSLGSPSTPGSLRSIQSSSNFKKEAQRSVFPEREDCAADHPLVSPTHANADDDAFFSLSPSSRAFTPKAKSSFKSNLTSSLQALKSAAIFSLASLKSSSPDDQRESRRNGPNTSPLADDILWSHPSLFPWLSSEIRPEIQGTPTQAQRRYLNPLPLTFEEQEAPFQQALHAPYLQEPSDGKPSIQLQTYSRGGSRSRSRPAPSKHSVKPDANFETGRASGTANAVANCGRHREPRENSDFLRVVVLEMNMRREGKLEMGRAKIWLPPRKECEEVLEPADTKIPRRWVGVSAD